MAAMKDVKFLARGLIGGSALGDPSQANVTGPTLEKYIQEKYFSNGFEIKDVFNGGITKDPAAGDILNLVFVLVRYE
jgi:hypothetical protein